MLPAVLLMAIFTLAAGAQPSGVISGTVVEASSGDAIRKAIVRLTWQGTPQAFAMVRTDSSGRFRFENLPAGKFALRATKPGIGAAVYGANSVRELGEFVELADGQIREGVTLRFIHGGSISGRVVDPEGDPIPGVAIELARAGRNLGERVLVNFRGATTNDRGEYRIANVDPGQYYLAANPMRGGWVPMQQISHQMLMRQFYGGARDSKDANPLTVRGGEGMTGLDFYLTAEPLVRIHGQITGVPDLPSTPPPTPAAPQLITERTQQVQVIVSSVEQGRPQQAMGTAWGGTDFRFDAGEIPVGRYRVEAEIQGKDRLYAASTMIDAQPGMGDVLLNLAPAIDLKGHLRIEGPGGPSLSSFNIALNGGRRNTVAHAGPDGNFTLFAVSESEWALVINPLPRGAFVKSALFGDKDVRFTRFEVGPKPDVTLNIVISMNSGRVEGEVDAAGADSARAGILLAPYGPLHNLVRFYYNTPAGADGKFKFSGIPPGKYKVFALEKMAAVNFRSPEATDNLDALGAEIEIAEGATVQVRPKLIPMERAREALP
jgi:protocatechuate 3,4-dioxygenase beta subunit